MVGPLYFLKKIVNLFVGGIVELVEHFHHQRLDMVHVFSKVGKSWVLLKFWTSAGYHEVVVPNKLV